VTRLFIVLLAIATPAMGTTVVLQRDGAAVAGGEVCRFPAGDRVNPLKRWLASQELTCVPAGAQVEFPRGVWNVFARVGGAAVSAEPLLIDGAPPAMSISLQPAATVAPLLPAGRRGVLYVPRQGSAFPAEERVTVPADEELWLFVLEKSVPVALFPIAPIAAGTERRVDARGDGPPAVIGWLQIAETDRYAIANATGLLSPGVRAFAGVVTRAADPLPSLRSLHGAFVRVRDVPAGNAELRIEGRGWIHDRRSVKVASTLSVAAQPLTLRAAGTLVVHWSTNHDLEALDRSLAACEEPAGSVGQLVEIAIASCPPRQRGAERSEPPECTPIRVEKFEPFPKMGSVTLDDLLPGNYQAEMRFGKLPPVSGESSVSPLQSRDIWLRASYEEAYGSLTHGGEALGEAARIDFPGGYGFVGEVSDEYRAVLREPVGIDARITVTACDGTPRAIVLTDAPMGRNARFDIDIPANELTINVTDTFTREPLRGATVRFEVMPLRRRGSGAVMQGKLTTAYDGNVVMESVPVREIHLNVSLPGYQKQDVEPFTMLRSGELTREVQLVPLRGNSGKIVSPHPFDSATVVWFSPDGRETERADLASDGTFVYANWHAPNETMAVVSLSHPLWVSYSPAIGRHEAIKVPFPAAAVRVFSVGLAAGGQRSWYIGIVIGGVRVPQPVLAIHQNLRREPAVAQPWRAMQLRDILATGPIDVILGPTTEEITGRTAAMDFFALPQFAGAPRERLEPDANTVVLTPK
jgi:hypothetical protein